MQQKKICQPSDCCQNDATSSKANSKPPTGALHSPVAVSVHRALSTTPSRERPVAYPKATATPHATPAVMKSRLSLLLRKRLKPKKPSRVAHGMAQPSVVLSPWLSAQPIKPPCGQITPMSNRTLAKSETLVVGQTFGPNDAAR
jgi:hypothetical protein